jgi:hypothetical protein
MSRRFASASSSLARCTLGAVVNYPITLFAWVKLPDWNTNAQGLVSIGETYGTTTNNSLLMWNQGAADRLTASAYDAAGVNQSILDFSVADSGNDAWIPCMARFTSATSRTAHAHYPRQNGGASTVERLITDLLDEIVIGRANSGSWQATNALIAEAAIWTSDIGTAGFDSLVTAAGTGISPDQVSSGSLLGYWSFRSDTGSSTVPDESGNGNDLTLSGTVTYEADHPSIIYATSRFLKVLVHPDAASASGVEGIVWATGGGIAGTEIGEFTGAEFEAETEGSGDAERAVLLVPVADFGGGSLSVDDVVPCLVRNATYTTGIITGTVIEE